RAHHIAEGPATGHSLLLRRYLEAESAKSDRGFKRTGGKEHPAIIPAALIWSGRKTFLRESLGQIGADRGTFGDHDIAMTDRRDLAHPVDGEVARLLHGRAKIEIFGLVRDADLLQHPARNPATRHRIGVECDLFVHDPPPSLPHVPLSGLTDTKNPALGRV